MEQSDIIDIQWTQVLCHEDYLSHICQFLYLRQIIYSVCLLSPWHVYFLKGTRGSIVVRRSLRYDFGDMWKMLNIHQDKDILCQIKRFYVDWEYLMQCARQANVNCKTICEPEVYYFDMQPLLSFEKSECVLHWIKKIPNVTNAENKHTTCVFSGRLYTSTNFKNNPLTITFLIYDIFKWTNEFEFEKLVAGIFKFYFNYQDAHTIFFRVLLGGLIQKMYHECRSNQYIAHHAYFKTARIIKYYRFILQYYYINNCKNCERKSLNYISSKDLENLLDLLTQFILFMIDRYSKDSEAPHSFNGSIFLQALMKKEKYPLLCKYFILDLVNVFYICFLHEYNKAEFHKLVVDKYKESITIKQLLLVIFGISARYDGE